MDRATLDQAASDALFEAGWLASRLRGGRPPDDQVIAWAAEDLETVGIREVNFGGPRRRAVQLPTPPPPSTRKALPKIVLTDPGFWVGMLAPIVVFFTLLITIAFVSDATVQTTLAIGAGSVGTLLATVTALGLGQRLGVNTDDVVKVLDKMQAIVAAYQSQSDEDSGAAAAAAVKVTIKEGAATPNPVKVKSGAKTTLSITSDKAGVVTIGTYIKDLALEAGVEKAAEETTFGDAATVDIDFKASGETEAKPVGKLTIEAS